MKLIKQCVKSKTMILAFLTAILPQAIELLPNLKVFLGNNYGLVFFVLSILMGIIRYQTTEPLSDK